MQKRKIKTGPSPQARPLSSRASLTGGGTWPRQTMISIISALIASTSRSVASAFVVFASDSDSALAVFASDSDSALGRLRLRLLRLLVRRRRRRLRLLHHLLRLLLFLGRLLRLLGRLLFLNFCLPAGHLGLQYTRGRDQQTPDYILSGHIRRFGQTRT